MSKAELCEAAYLHDCAYWDKQLIFSGIDEAGRGPLAGPVFAACVVLPREPRIAGLIDSKKTSVKARQQLELQIRQHAQFIGVGSADVAEIDEINILNATKLAMKRAAEGSSAALHLIDAVNNLGLIGQELSLIKGDLISYSVAAASIIAKVTRDRYMDELALRYPLYGFEQHKGYGTARHIQAIRQHGPCPEHRLGFLGKILAG